MVASIALLPAHGGAQSVDNPGTVSLSGAAAVGTALTATLADDDTVSGTPTWQWSRSASPEGIHENISGAASATYTPGDGDSGYFLTATASYTDGHGPGKTASAITALPTDVDERVLASSLQSSGTDNVSELDFRRRFGFTTGSSPLGYALTQVGVKLKATSIATASLTNPQIRERVGDLEGDLVGSLSVPDTLTLDGMNWLKVPEGTQLALKPDTAYWVTFDSLRSAVTRNATDLDSSGLEGWSFQNEVAAIIGKPHLFIMSTGTARMELKGYASLRGPPSAPALSVSPGEGSVTLSWDAPAENGGSAITKYQFRYRLSDGAEGLWADVSDSDSDGDFADERSETVSNLEEGRLYEFEVRAVNSLESGGTVARHAYASPVLVTNFGKDDSTSSDNLHLQTFGTGLAMRGYTLYGVEVAVLASETATPVVRILSGFSDGSTVDPASVVATLTEAGRSAAGARVFAAPEGTVLKPDTAYYMLITSDNDSKLDIGRIDDASGQDIGGAAGWTLGFRRERATRTVAWTQSDKAAKVRIIGAVHDTPGVVSFSGNPRVGTALTAALADDDTVSGTPTWQWSRSTDPAGTFADISGATSAAYTPVGDDRGYFLTATASYTDELGPGKTASATPTRPTNVIERTLASSLLPKGTISPRPEIRDAKLGFTTGSNPQGYALTKVGVRLKAIGAATATLTGARIRERFGNRVGPLVGSLSLPDSVTLNINWLDVPDGTHLLLEPDTDYWLMFAVVRPLSTRTLTSLDAGGPQGWSFDKVVGTEGAIPRIEFDGFPLLGPPSAPALSVSPGEGSVALSWDAPAESGGRAVTKYQFRYRLSGDAEGLWADVSDSDGDGDLDDERSETVSNLEEGRLYEFEVRAVNSLGSGGIVTWHAYASSVLVTNFGKNDSTSSNNLHLQALTTGNAVGGYALTGVEVVVPAAETATPVVRIVSDDTDDSTVNPATVVATLTEAGRSAAEARIFAAPADTVLTPETAYYVEITSANTDTKLDIGRIDDASGEDIGGTPGWTLGTRHERYAPTAAWTVSNKAAKVRIVGTAHDALGAVSFSGNPKVDVALTASLSDADGGVTNLEWVWSKSATHAGTFAAISGATSASYTPVTGDLGSYLKATVTYTDAFDSDEKQAESVTASEVLALTAPRFVDGSSTTRSAAENTAGGDVGAAVQAADADGDAVAYSVTHIAGSDGAAHLSAFNRDFSLDASTGQVSVRSGASIDYEARSSYAVLIQVTDSEDADGNTQAIPTVDAEIALTITVTNQDDAGAVSLSGPAYLGVALSASVSDPDGTPVDELWQWSRSDNSTGPFTDINGATSATYTPAGDDDGKFLRVAANYTDPMFGRSEQLIATTPAAVRARPASSTPSTPDSGSASGSASGGGGGDVDVGVATFVAANGWSPADVGVASVLAARTDSAVVVYTAAGELSPETSMLLREASPAEVIIIGGHAAVSRNVRTQILAASPQSGITRITGADRIDTAAQTARRLLGDTATSTRVTFIIANGWSPPDIGAAAALAARSGRAAVAYTEHHALPDATAALLRDYPTARVVLIGGTAAISAAVHTQAAQAAPDASTTRLTGADRIDTAAQTARRVLGDPASAPDGITLVIANGWSPPDIGVAAALTAATPNSAVAYTNTDTLPDATAALIRDYRPAQIIIIGGTAAITDNARDTIAQTAPDTATTRRITGTTRTDTAANAARRTLRNQ